MEAADLVKQFLVKHLDGLTACCHHWGMSKKSKKPKKANDLTGYESAQRKRFIRSEQESDNQETSSVLLWHKTYIKRIRQRFGLSKYQMLWITFGKGIVIGYALAFFLHR